MHRVVGRQNAGKKLWLENVARFKPGEMAAGSRLGVSLLCRMLMAKAEGSDGTQNSKVMRRRAFGYLRIGTGSKGAYRPHAPRPLGKKAARFVFVCLEAWLRQ